MGSRYAPHGMKRHSFECWKRTDSGSIVAGCWCYLLKHSQLLTRGEYQHVERQRLAVLADVEQLRHG